MYTYFVILVSSLLMNNFVMNKFLGICPFLGVSKRVDSAVGMGGAVTLVMVLAIAVTWPIQQLLTRWGLEYLQTIAFILVIATLVQLLEMAIKRYLPPLYASLGVFLPLITTNCCILGVAILVAGGTYNAQGLERDLLTGIIFAFSTAIGFALALTIFAGMREQLSMMNIPMGMQGMPIALVTAGLLAMAFMGFSGVDNGLSKAFGL